MCRRVLIGLVLVIGFDCQLMLAAENWPQWRGPLGTGVAADGEYPVKFSSAEGVAWKAVLPGIGTSTPAVWGERIFVTCGIDGQDGVVCYDMSGNELWRRQLGPERRGKHRNGTGSNPSPVTNGEHVVVYYKSGTLACLDVAGNEKWKVNLQDRFGKDTLWWDLGSSPVLAGGRAIVAVMQDGESYLVALNLEDGGIAWKQPRKYDCPEESDQSYSTPQVVQFDGNDVLVTWGADHLTGHDAATGMLLWECGGFNPRGESNWRTIASAAVSDGIAVVPYARGSFLAGVRLGGNGDITKSGRIWEKNGRGQSADVPTPVAADGKVYVLNDLGRIACLDMQSGHELWWAELPNNRNKFYASPVLAGDKFYCAREDGAVFVGRVSDKGFEQLAENQMGERIIATPVPIRSGLLLRGDEHLFRVGSK